MPPARHSRPSFNRKPRWVWFRLESAWRFFLYFGIPARCRIGSRALMSFNALARDLPKSRMSCCSGTELPSRSQAFTVQAAVSILSSRAGPHFSSSAWALFDLAAHSFQIHRHRVHSASRAARAVDDTRSR